MKIKIILIKLFVVLFTLVSYSQSKHEFAITYGKSFGTATFSILRNGFLMGAASSSLQNNNAFGVRYFRPFKDKERIKMEFGLNYLSGTLRIMPATTGDPIFDAPKYTDFNLLSLPVYMNHSFGKYFYFNYGLMFDYQNTDFGTYTGIGLGIGFGIGARYNYKKYFFYLNPKYEKHLFLSEAYGLMEFGIMGGIGYSF